MFPMLEWRESGSTADAAPDASESGGVGCVDEFADGSAICLGKSKRAS